MKHAISHLGIAADIAEHNLPYSEEAGDSAQAALQTEVAADCRAAAEQLQSGDHDSSVEW